jgi:hypothetical protein
LELAPGHENTLWQTAVHLRDRNRAGNRISEELDSGWKIDFPVPRQRIDPVSKDQKAYLDFFIVEVK